MVLLCAELSGVVASFPIRRRRHEQQPRARSSASRGSDNGVRQEQPATTHTQQEQEVGAEVACHERRRAHRKRHGDTATAPFVHPRWPPRSTAPASSCEHAGTLAARHAWPAMRRRARGGFLAMRRWGQGWRLRLAASHTRNRQPWPRLTAAAIALLSAHHTPTDGLPSCLATAPPRSLGPLLSIGSLLSSPDHSACVLAL
jgi:hypothetical protein